MLVDSRAKKLVLTVTICLAVALVISLFVTNPTRLGPFGITTWFLCVLTVVSGLATLVLDRLRPRRGFSVNLRHGVLGATWLTALFALSSLGQIGVKDVVLVSVLVVLIEFYLSRAR
jgi:hypothetical protein